MGGGDSEVPEQPGLAARADVARQKWNRYQEKFKPVEDFFIRRVDRLPGEEARVKGEATTDVKGQFGNASEKLDAGLAKRGAAAGSGRQVMGLGGLGLDQAASEANADAGAHAAVTSEYVKGLQTIMKMGEGKSIDATYGLDASSRIAGEVAESDARRSSAERGGWGELAGTAAGYGLQRMNTPRGPAPTGSPTTPGGGAGVNFQMPSSVPSLSAPWQ